MSSSKRISRIQTDLNTHKAFRTYIDKQRCNSLHIFPLHEQIHKKVMYGKQSQEIIPEFKCSLMTRIGRAAGRRGDCVLFTQPSNQKRPLQKALHQTYCRNAAIRSQCQNAASLSLLCQFAEKVLGETTMASNVCKLNSTPCYMMESKDNSHVPYMHIKFVTLSPTGIRIPTNNNN